MKPTRQDAEAALRYLARFINAAELAAIRQAMAGEERQAFIDKACELAELIRDMPSTYQTDGQGDDAIAWLHYFSGGFDWYITERDSTEEQHQAFGLADMGEPELGYIDISQLIAAGVQLDLYWEPKPLRELKARRAA